VTSWQTLLLIQMYKGKYLSSKPPTEEHWLRLWVLVHETYPAYLVIG